MKTLEMLYNVYALSLLQRMQERNIFDKSLYVETCIRGAKHPLLEENDLEMAIRLREAYKTIFSRQSVSTPSTEYEQTLDIHVLHSCGEHDCYYQNFATSTLKTFVQCKFVVNNDDCPPSHRRFEYMIEAMCRA